MSKLLKNFLINTKREKFLTFANIGIMTISLLILGIFISIVVLSQTALKTLEQQAQLTVFFKDDFPEANILQLKTELEADTKVLKVSYVSKEQAFRIFTDINKDQPVLLQSVSKDILPASLEIKTKSLSYLPTLASSIEKHDGVEDVKFFKDVIEKFRTWSTVIYAVGFTLAVLFFVISYAVIVVTLRMTINSKKSELEIMKLVGASDSYIRSPLIQQGMMFGLISSLVSSVVLALLILGGRLTGLIPQMLGVAFLPSLSINTLVYAIALVVIIVASGVGLGYLGSVSAVKKYLKY